MRVDRTTVSVVILLAVAAVGGEPPRTATEGALQKELAETRRQLMRAEIDLENVKKMLRFGPELPQAEQAVREAAQRARISAIEMKAVSENGEPVTAVAFQRLDVSGRASYENVDKFLHRLTIANMGVDFEELRLDAAPAQTVAFKVRIVYPILNRPPAAVPPTAVSPPAAGKTPQEQAQAAREAVIRRMIEEERAQLHYLRAAADELRKTFARFRARDRVNALASFAYEMHNRAIALTAVRASDKTILSGFTAGGRAAKAIRPALEKSGFEVVSVDLKPGSLCTSFTAVARLKEGERPLDLALSNGLFDDKAPSICSAHTAASADIDVRGSDPKGITLRLRDADAPAVFMLLHDASGENFVAGKAIDRRLNVTATNTTVADILDRLRAAGLPVSGGRVHRLPSGVFREQTWAGQPVNFVIRDADLADVLCLFHQISELPILMRRDMRPRVSAFLKEVPWDEALAGIIASAGEEYAIDNNRLFVGTKRGDPAAVDSCATATSLSSARQWWLASTRLEDIEAGDLTLAGVASAGGGWKAYAYGPMRKVFTLDRDTRLADAWVVSVGIEGATLETSAGQRIELRFSGK